MNTIKLLDSTPISYQRYVEETEVMVAEGRTTGANQSEAMLAYTKLNLSRMRRLNKTVHPGSELVESLSQMPFAMKWIAITEPWCGDAAQNLPYIAKAAALSGNVDLGLVYRDENLRYMEKFLTNGTRSIPKLVMYRADDNEVIATWGPRPAAVQQKVNDYKNAVGEKPTFEVFAAEIHAWYTADKNTELESELLSIFRKIQAETAAV